MAKLGPLTLDTIVVCEGKEDKALVDQMIAEGLVRPMHTVSIGEVSGSTGIDALKDELQAISVVTGFDRIRKLAIIADNDLVNPTADIRILNAIAAANATPDVNGALSVPAAAFHRGMGAKIETAFFLCPGPGQTGCFENVLNDVLRRLYAGKVHCVDQFIQCASSSQPPSAWIPSKEQKARVRISLTALHTTNPNVPVQALWRENPLLVPASSPEFAFLSVLLNAL